MARTWRLLECGTTEPPKDVFQIRTGEAVWNMAFDAAMFASLISENGGPALRLYRWNLPAITVGRFQDVARTLDEARCRRLDIPVVRRITGGRGIYHGDDLTLSMVNSLQDLGLDSASRCRTQDIYRKYAAVFVGAFRRVGIECQAGVDIESPSDSRDVSGNCFDATTAADIVEVGTRRKVLGAAIHRSRNWLLLQASVPLCSAGQLPDVFVGSREFGGPKYILDAREFATALVAEVVHCMSATFVTDERVAGQFDGARRLVETRYRDARWNLSMKSGSD